MRIRSELKGYLAAVAASSAVFIGWMYGVEMDGATRQEIGLASVLGFALLEWPVIAIGIFLLMYFPWRIALRIGERTGLAGPVFFPAVGACAAFVFFCAIAAILPRGAAAEQRSVLQAFGDAAGAHGLALLASGFVGGFAYWRVSRTGDRPGMKS